MVLTLGMINRWITNMVFMLTLRCKGFERIESRSLDEPISWSHRVAKFGHWLACSRCRHTVHQLDTIEKVVRSIPKSDPVVLPEDARDRIANRLRSSKHDDASQKSQND